MVDPKLRDRLLPHQVAFVEGVLELEPPARVVLAAGPGTGKTVAATGVLVGLAGAHAPAAFRALVLTSQRVLQQQWVDALTVAGPLDVKVVDARAYRNMQAHSAADENPWSRAGVFVSTVRFVNREPLLRQLQELSWDVVLVDDLDSMEGIEADSLVGKLWASTRVARAIGLARAAYEPTGLPAVPAKVHVFRYDLDSIRDWNGRPLGAARELRYVHVELSAAEKRLYEALHAALRQVDERVAPLLLKRFSSSTLGLYEFLERQLVRQSDVHQLTLFDPEEDRDPDEQPEQLQLFLASDASEDAVLPAAACRELLALIEALDRDSKFEACERVLEQAEKEHEVARVAVFTDYARTAEYLAEVLGDERPDTWLLTCVMATEARRKCVEEHSARGGLLVSTTAACQGLDLSDVATTIHYDIPWSPAVLERRMAAVERLSADRPKRTHVFLVDDRTMSERLIKRIADLRASPAVDELVDELRQLLGSSDKPLPMDGVSPQGLLKRLKTLGFDREFVLGRLLPRRLSESLRSEAGKRKPSPVAGEAARVIVDTFSWTPAQLTGEEDLLLTSGGVLFKKSTKVNSSRLRATVAYARFLAQLVLKATSRIAVRPVPQDASEVRSAILSLHSELTFESALHYVWSLGIPVLPLDEVGGLHGACWRVSGRSILLLKQPQRSPARWLFDLLHELKHAAQFPGEDNFEFLDSEESDMTEDAEMEAGEFAGDVILGGEAERLAELCVEAAHESVEHLKRAVVDVARERGVGQDALANYMAFRLSLQGIDWWGAAANLQEQGDPWTVARDQLLPVLDLSVLHDDDRERLLRALGK